MIYKIVLDFKSWGEILFYTMYLKKIAISIDGYFAKKLIETGLRDIFFKIESILITLIKTSIIDLFFIKINSTDS